MKRKILTLRQTDSINNVVSAMTYLFLTALLVHFAIDIADKSLYLMLSYIIAAVLNVLISICYLVAPDARKTIVWLAVRMGVFGIGAFIAEWVLFT